MAEDDFYMHLPSNSSMDYYPENTLSNYTVKLDQTVDLTNGGSWYVGMAEILYPREYHNIREPFNYVACTFDDGETPRPWHVFPLDPGRYTIHDVVYIVNNLFKGKPQKFKYHYETSMNRLVFQGDEKNTGALMFNEQLAKLLGYGRQYSFSLNTNYEIAPHSPSLETSMPPLLFVYTNIVQSQIVGGEKHPLLRIVNTSGAATGEDITTVMASKIYEKIYYLPLQLKLLDEIVINIRDEAGSPIAFAPGILSITLHFKRRRSGGGGGDE